VRRILATDFSNLPAEAIVSFDEGLALHDARRLRPVSMRRRTAVLRAYAATNKLLPRTRELILKKESPWSGLNSRSGQVIIVPVAFARAPTGHLTSRAAVQDGL
jgi:hypothetical protein